MMHMKVNGRSIPYPNDFTMKKEDHIVGEIKTASGATYADVNGWSYADTTLQWDTLLGDDLETLLTEMSGTFTLEFVNITGGLESVRAFRRSLEYQKTEIMHDGSVVWRDVTMEVSFPDAYN